MFVFFYILVLVMQHNSTGKIIFVREMALISKVDTHVMIITFFIMCYLPFA